MASVTTIAHARGERGAELIELMLVFPILMLILAGIVDFGMMLRSYEVVTNAAREGARVAVLDANYSDAEIGARVNAYLASAGMGPATVPAPVTVPVTVGGRTFMARSVTVNFQYQWTALGPIAAFFGGNFTTLPLQATSVMRMEVQPPAAAP